MVQSVLVDVNEARSDAAPEEVAALLRERIYGGIAASAPCCCCATRGRSRPRGRWSMDVVVATGSLWAASLLPISSRTWPRTEARRAGGAGRMFRTSGQILKRPCPAGAARARRVGVLRSSALRAGVWVSVITLACSPARRAAHKLAGWKRSSSSRR
jgi:hypothetical protein